MYTKRQETRYLGVTALIVFQPAEEIMVVKVLQLRSMDRSLLASFILFGALP